MMQEAGQKLKRARERLNLRYRDVEEASLRIAERHKNDEFIIALSRLADIENKGTVPSLYRLYSLCTIYRLDLHEVMEWYGVDISQMPADAMSIEIERTHTVGFDTDGHGEVQLPLSLDPGLAPDHLSEPDDPALGQAAPYVIERAGLEEPPLRLHWHRRLDHVSAASARLLRAD